ncbi:MAG: hypothetical protein A3C11_00470 [Candidatus Sungbacteria bacterium RIFCSPHIGHO2_02_FULL_49_12]|uniref:Uncharacterized protein n=1 Tax=Candidatus Sungbacteria bacterium RIFCSPHIGHO2_02_FULL_49_12 TaxID=1802271 RepID=A0A1G2KM35_9BACT|nr:MAG: hypothetical protein A3C11_00470 [Candidatus Sungbacteria bacterium RIFCSPHIGHO2_02_FULL_49_12]
MSLHTSLANGRWQELSFFDQMGNIGSEVGRMRKRQSTDILESQKALERALELIDLTRADPRWHNFPRLKELCRLRETLLDAWLAEPGNASELNGLDNYLLQFALAARLQK